MRPVIALAGAAAALALTGSAIAQPHEWTNETNRNDDFGRCSQLSREHAERNLRSCRRIIGERISSEHTAAAHFFRGRLHDLLGRPDEAREDYEEAYRLFSVAVDSRRNDPATYRNRASALYRLGRYQEALQDYDAALAAADAAQSNLGTRARSNVADRRANEISDLNARRGGVLFRMLDWSQAAAAFDEAAQAAPDVSGYRASQCEALAAAGDFDTAEQACGRALQLRPRDSRALFALGFLRFKQGRSLEAMQGFAAAFEEDPENYIGLHARGVALHSAGQTSAAEADIARAAAEIDPDELAYYAGAGLRR